MKIKSKKATFTIPENLLAKLEIVSEESMVNKSKIISKLLSKFFNNGNKFE
jgi:metal-responsive CopG/Arc/MetJ family transcriptional regulator